MRVTINGEVQDLATSGDPLTVEQLLIQCGLPVDRVAVEHNGRVVRRSERPERVVVDGDVLEVVTLVGGG
jgi:thiamine biosynthesis protein ThiS